MASKRRDREDFILRMVKEGMPAESARLILRHAATMQRLAVEACNRELSKAEILRDEAAMARILALLAKCPDGFEAKFNGDPRGSVVKIAVPSGYSDDWGGEGVCVPTRRG